MYYSPPGFVMGGSNIITLTHNSANVDSFLGYDVYYRAFSTLSDATTARVTIENASNLNTATPEGVLAQLTGTQGFKKMYLFSNATVSPTPLLSGASTYTIQLVNTSTTTNWYFYTDTNPTAHIELVRGTGSGECFNAGYSVGTSDYTSSDSLSKSSGQNVFIVAFAVAYGYDFTKLQSIYSFPASLGQVLWDATYGYPLP